MMNTFYTNILQWGNQLFLREVVNGQRQVRKVKYQPTLYTPCEKVSGFKTLTGGNAAPIKFDNIKDAKEWAKQYENQKDLVLGLNQFPYTYLAEQYPNAVNWDLDHILIYTIDIEVKCENGFPNPQEAAEPFLSITVKNHSNKQIIVWGVGKYTNDRDDVTYIECESEIHLLKEFLIFWEKSPPDIITGWNTEFFDIPYLCNRMKQLFGEDELKRLSPWRMVQDKEVYNSGRKHQLYDIRGIAHLDYLDLYHKFTYTSQESYALTHIAYVELGQKKDTNPYETFSEWYTKDFQSFIDYNILDVELVDRIEDKMRLIELCLTMAYEAKVNYMDVLGSVKYWDVLIYNYLKKKNIVIPQKRHSEKAEKFEGAYVKDPIVGEHKWVMSFDLNSLYPHLMMQYNISPETLKSLDTVKGMKVDKLLNKEVDTSIFKNTTMTPNGALFKTNIKGFLPELMEDMYNDRVVFKKKMLQAKQEYENTKEPKLLKKISKYDNIQMARKIALNSAYGAIGNQYFRYYSLAMAEAVTTSGQLSIRWIENKINDYMNDLMKTDNQDYVVASDTDSIYVTFGSLVDKFNPSSPIDFLNTIAKDKIEPYISKCYQELATYTKAYQQKMEMSREVIADKGIWTAKKRYILNVWDNEGVRYQEPKLKIMGIEAVKSSTPEPCRNKIKEGLKIIMSGDEKMLNKFIQDFREEFMNMPPEDIAYPRSVNGLTKWSDPSSLFAKGAPIHCKGAILYNHLLKQKKLVNKYPYIQEGDKIKFLHLRIPNAHQSSSISFITKMPKEFELQSMIDYEQQFEKSFVEPLNFIVSKLKWTVDRTYGQQGNLMDFL